MAESPLIVLLTDFGSVDPFAGILRGVIAGISPDVPILDLTNEISAGDVRRAAITLWQARAYFPGGAIFLSVVDPGVGTSRRPLLVRSGRHAFIGPDNGLFTFVLDNDYQAWEIRNPAVTLPNPGSTFHGRDIFAPAAAHLARGVPAPEFGPRVAELHRLALPRLDSPSPGVLIGEVLHTDRFGNLLTSLGSFEFSTDRERILLSPWVPGVAQTSFSPHNLRFTLPSGAGLTWATTFADVSLGSCAVILGSSGLLEIVAHRQSAAKLLGLSGGEFITLYNMEIHNG